MCIFNVIFANTLHRFSLPFFDENGTKICDIFGRQADTMDSKNLKVSDMVIQIFPKNEGGLGQKTSITSEQANINFVENWASGTGFISISNNEFSATGSDWQLLGNFKNFILNKNAQVFFGGIK
jgi:hypothetical protein